MDTLLNWDVEVAEIDEITDDEWFKDIDFDSLQYPKPTYVCGEFHWQINPENGLHACSRWFCKDPYNCLDCYEIRYQDILEQLKGIAELDNVRLIKTDRTVTGEYGKKRCLNLPSSDGIYSLVQTEDESIGIPFKPEMVNDLAKLAIPPKGKRISGSLGKKPAAPKSVPVATEEVNCLVWKVTSSNGDSLSNDEQKQVMSKVNIAVLEQSLNILPKTVEDVQAAVKVVENLTTKEVLALGYDILFLYSARTPIIENKIDWSKRKDYLDQLKERHNASPKPPLSG